MHRLRVVTLHGGLGDGQQVKLGYSRSWCVWAAPSSKPARTPGALRYEYEQYAPDDEGVWRPIGPGHPSYLA